MRFLNPGMFALALLCFLLPFTNIKCNQQRIASVKGIDLIRNAPVQEVVQVQGMMSGMFSKITSQMPKDGDGGDERLTEYPLLGAFLVLLVAGIATLVLAIKKKSNKTLAIWGIAAFALVLLLLLLEMVAMEFAMAKINQ
ncbi:MAG: hypothetical protein M0D57_10000 [Sphingobacteriales bacterium JAD_PAG50586_3]|nr:MAG: hypothetical protein M0D57_10000 [Sphingobacteriales bacterium JAD_PAG50586_3]